MFERGDTLLIENDLTYCEIEITKKLGTQYGGAAYEFLLNEEGSREGYVWISGTIVKELI